MAGENAAGNAICSICYEDLKPVVENLQSISACGHVFHELWLVRHNQRSFEVSYALIFRLIDFFRNPSLQQWFEYCPSTNKRNCPICKQKCLLKDPCRLYFQSSGDQIDSIASRKIVEIEEDPALLRGEVKRLEGKIQNLTSALEGQKKENAEVSEKVIFFIRAHRCSLIWDKDIDG